MNLLKKYSKAITLYFLIELAMISAVSLYNKDAAMIRVFYLVKVVGFLVNIYVLNLIFFDDYK